MSLVSERKTRKRRFFMDSDYKVCPECGENKHRDNFYWTKKGYSLPRCKVCTLKLQKEWRDANLDTIKALHKAWKRAHEGHTYLDNKTGYVRYIGYEHPIANPSGLTPAHRIVLFDKIGPGQHECHWGCGRILSWDAKYPEDPEHALTVDHVNNQREDNRPENLVPSCGPCNVKRGAKQRVGEPKPLCTFAPCDRPVLGLQDLCKTHYKQRWAGQPLKPIRKKVMAPKNEQGRVCTACDTFKEWSEFNLNTVTGKYRSNCKNCQSKKAMANKHSRLARNIPCSVPGCSDNALNKGMCSKHYYRSLR